VEPTPYRKKDTAFYEMLDGTSERVGSCERSNEPLGSTESEGFLD